MTFETTSQSWPDKHFCGFHATYLRHGCPGLFVKMCFELCVMGE